MERDLSYSGFESGSYDFVPQRVLTPIVEDWWTAIVTEESNEFSPPKGVPRSLTAYVRRLKIGERSQHLSPPLCNHDTV